MKSKLLSAVPVLVAAVLGMALSQLTLNDQPATGQQPKRVAFDDVTVAVPEYVPAEEGAGFKPPVEAEDCCKCPCEGKCLDEDAVRKICRDECEKFHKSYSPKKAVSASEPTVSSSRVVSYGSPVVTYSSPTVTYSSGNCGVSPSSYYYSQPTTTYRSGLFGRRVYSSGGSCRMVNGRMVCGQ